MSAVTETLVREYFEMQGYFVSQPRKYAVPGRPRTADEEVDLVVINPTVSATIKPTNFLWSSADLRHVPRAVVGILGWHTDRFYLSTFEKTPELLKFLQPASLEFAGKLLGTSEMARVLCLPKMPASGDLRDQAIAFLKGQGVDGVIPFRTILAELLTHVDVNRNYEKSDVLQMLRLMKNYELIRDDQLDLFTHKRRPRKAAPKAQE